LPTFSCDDMHTTSTSDVLNTEFFSDDRSSLLSDEGSCTGSVGTNVARADGEV
jgi:hypothetical protein